MEEENLVEPEQSKTAFVANTKFSVQLTHFIKEGLLIPIPFNKQVAKILKPFYIQLLLTADGYMATSRISDIYELEPSIQEAVRNYLFSLVDEVIWLEEKRENLSALLAQQLENIQTYISFV